ncbi:hypothetical protein Psi02_79980 [Planotetraspora silvatica]|uniref:Uncharacterized protein n=1 Tax=Planotetraspora silvatica TaxID=234614 RepID=A0A8J3XSU7_9ACTN|nr:hypothetical protein Psi02_79980 [Planotetraspora silvatica]
MPHPAEGSNSPCGGKAHGGRCTAGQVLDRILISPAIKVYADGVNAEFSDHASDHDLQIVRILAGCDGRRLPARCLPGNP